MRPITAAGRISGSNQSICDPTTYNQCATVDSSGRLTFLLGGSPAVTVTGGASAANQTATMGPVTPGSVSLNSQLTGCQYNSSAPSPSPTQALATQCDNQGNVKVNIAQVAGIVEGSTTTGQTGALVMGMVITSPQAFTAGTSHIVSMNPNGDTRADQMVTQGNAGAPTLAHICGQHVTVNPVTATDTLLVAAVAAKSVYVCDYAISTGAADNLFLESFTTGTCAGTVAQMDTKWFMPINGAKTDANRLLARPGDGGRQRRLLEHIDHRPRQLHPLFRPVLMRWLALIGLLMALPAAGQGLTLTGVGTVAAGAGGGGGFNTWDSATFTNWTFTNGNLTANCKVSFCSTGNAGVVAGTTAINPATDVRKIYFEITPAVTGVDGYLRCWFWHERR